MITKLKYVGTQTEDLINIYILFIRSCTEYCAVAFHSGLTLSQTADLERIQKTCLKVILGINYVSYEAALEMCGLDTLYDRREKRCLDFSLKCIKHPRNKAIFPLNGPELKTKKEKFAVHFARTQTYKKSAIPYCQKMLNDHFAKIK